MSKLWCVGGKHYSNTNNTIQYDKVNPKTKKLFKILKELVVYAIVKNHKFSLK